MCVQTHARTNLPPTNPGHMICGGVLTTCPSAVSSTCLNIMFHHPEHLFFFFFKLKKIGSLSHSKEGRKGKINSFFILFFSFSCLFLNRRVTSLWLLLSNSPGMRRSGLTWRLTRPGGRGCVCLRSVELRADPSPEATATNPLAHVESLVRTVRSSWEGVLVLKASSSLLESTGQSTDIHYFVLSPPRGCEFRTAFSISEMRKLTCRG